MWSSLQNQMALNFRHVTSADNTSLVPEAGRYKLHVSNLQYQSMYLPVTALSACSNKARKTHYLVETIKLEL